MGSALRDRRCRILLVEDDADARTAMRTLLELSGHHVEVAGDGAEGVELARRAVPDVALVDIGLPGMDGYEVAQHLRALPDGKRMYLVALTGYGQRSDQATEEAGFDAHLLKPVDVDEIGRLIARLVTRQADEGGGAR